MATTSTDSIVYVLVSKPGGMDGMDRSKGGEIIGAYLSRSEAAGAPNLPWAEIKAQVHDLNDVAKKALAKLNPLERLALKVQNCGQ